ncbi:MAG: AAA family ATPase [Thiomicrorhabdus sp.]|jgi:replicative DNA helicase|nr:AAA family ATPase [Thiomicrorhabdus sp.]
MIIETPFSLEAEQAVIGAIMLDGLKTDAVLSAYESLSAESFHHPIHQEIFNAVGLLVAKRFIPDLVTLGGFITEHRPYLAEIMRNSTGAANISYYARMVKEKHSERRLLEILIMSQNTLGDSIPHDEKFDRVNALLKEIDNGDDSHEVHQISHYIDEVVDGVSELLNSNSVSGTATGFGELDRHIGGMGDGELITIGARPSVGKSALGMNIVENVATTGKTVLYITMEMPGVALAGRVICSQGRVNNLILKNPSAVEQDEWAKFDMGGQKASSLPIFVSDLPKPSVNQIKAVARNFKRASQVDLVVVDHLHLMRHDKSQGEVQGIGDTTSELKGLAMELGVPVLLMSQLNRGNAKENRFPAITDLRGSGAIEQDSDVVMLIHRNDEDDELKGKAIVILSKNRSGEKDVAIVLKNNLQNYRFDNFANIDERY